MDQERAVLLEDANRVELDLAQNLLAEAGIPCVIEGPDFDVAELGRAAHDATRRQSLLVPRSAIERARKILEEAWGDEDELAGVAHGPGARDDGPEDRPAPGRRSPLTVPALAILVLVLGYLWFDSRETLARAERGDPLFDVDYDRFSTTLTWRGTEDRASETFDEDGNGTPERVLWYDRHGVRLSEGIDLDQDGVFESTRHFDGAGQLQQEITDLDEDGRPDRVVEHRASGVRIEWRDEDSDGAFELRDLYDRSGELVRVERDLELQGWVEESPKRRP